MEQALEIVEEKLIPETHFVRVRILEDYGFYKKNDIVTLDECDADDLVLEGKAIQVCISCDRKATRYHCNHDTGINEHLCERHYSAWEPGLANVKIEDKLFSYYEGGITNTIPTRQINFEEFLEFLQEDSELKSKIREEKDKDKRQQLKRGLPYITFSGIFSTRGKTNLIESSGYACFDVDDIQDREKVLDRIISDKYTFCCWESPSGAGLKFLVKIPFVKSDEEYKKYWNAIARHYNINENDEATKDISRACYISYDPYPFFHRDSEIFLDKLDDTVISKISEPVEEVKKSKDESRSGLEYRRIIALFREGKTREEICKIMTAYSKWISSPEQYRQHQLDNAESFVLSEQEGREKSKDKPELILPHEGKLISEFATEVSNVLKDKNILFYRVDAKELVEIERSGFRGIKPNRFITLAERFIIPQARIWNKHAEKWEYKEKSMWTELAGTLLASSILQDSLPQIKRIFTIPLPIMYEGKLTFPIKGYDKRFESWLQHDAPEIDNTNIDLLEAKKVIEEIYSEFCFKDNQDKINAIAALLTPYCRGIFKSFNTRTPVNFYLGNRERAGKDYCAGITGIVYEGAALEDSPISNSENERSNNTDELRKKVLAAMISGRKRMHFSNNKGYIDNAVLEGFTTAERWSDRILGRSENLSFDNEIDFSLSGNVGVTFTADFANRSRFIRLLLDVEDANSRNFKKSNLHGWVKENRSLILSALYSLVNNWITKGMPSGSKPFTSFPEWARVVGGIMECAGYGSPCSPDKETLTLAGDIETNDMKQLFELCYEQIPEEFVKKEVIRNLVSMHGEEIFSSYDFTKRADQIKLALKISKYVGRVLSSIRLVVKDSSVRASRQEYKFTKKEGGLL